MRPSPWQQLHLSMPCENRDCLVLTSRCETSLSEKVIVHLQILMLYHDDIHCTIRGLLSSCKLPCVQTFGMLSSHAGGGKRENNISSLQRSHVHGYSTVYFVHEPNSNM
jgi:hypothetical protein